MDGRVRIACAGWLATMAAAVALKPLVDGTDWLVQAGVLLAAQTWTGLMARWRRAPAVVTVAAQIGVSLVLLTVVSAREYALAGFLPGPQALDALGRLIGTGADDIGRYMAPAPATDGIRLMLFGGVLLIGLLVDVLAVAARSAAAAGLPLLALYSVAAGVAEDDSGWPYFLAAAAGFLVLLLAEGRDRAARWGRFLGTPGAPGGVPGAPGGGGATALRAPGAAPRLRAGGRIGVLALALAALAPVLLPALGQGVLDREREGRAGGRGGSGEVLALDPVVALQDQLNQPADRTLLLYRTDSPEPDELYLRLMALDEFTGTEWRSSEWQESAPPDAPWPVPGLAPDVPRQTVRTVVESADGYAQTSLPVPYPAQDISVDGEWGFDRGSQTLVAGDTDLTTQGLGYTVESLLVQPTEEQLTGAPATPEDILEYYTRVPDNLPSEVYAQALDITADADNDLERAVALQNWFTQEGGFRYDTSVASGSGPEAIVSFLENREGFCVHFAFTMAAMARTLGIPAQVAVGFTPGTQLPSGVYEVSAHNAHAWPELYFEGVGWVRFEPTPGQGTSPSYARPEQEQPGQEETERPEADTEPTAPADPTPAPEPSETPPGQCAAGSTLAECGDDDRPNTPESAAGGAGLPPAPLLWGLGVLLVVLALAWPSLWRRRTSRRRLAPDAGPLPAWEELQDAAWDIGIAPAGWETPRQTAGRLVRVGGLSGDAAAAVGRLAAAVEEELYAPWPGRSAAAGAARDVRVARDGLRAGASRWRRLRAAVLPRSAIRVMRTLAERRSAAARRLRSMGRRLLPRRAAR
ncbi:DUF3488 and transglutaminase-like domain-containing protein [Streptomyces sp. RFCAC02]|uniref:transglutaminase family protein n=1 Tax=Streptomyces sp. RFCAC02 TaxID=2499143 RepID=UPI001020D4F2|nr:DUF3488 and transglutaminase-like domain-containing protein [Streptomyces sp. RFCAC02]